MIIRDQKTLDIGVKLLQSLDVDNMPEPMELFLIPLKNKRKKRSVEQSAVLWGWCDKFGKHSGNFKDYMYRYFEREFCPFIDIKIGTKVTAIQCAKALNTKEFSEYMETIYYWLEIEQDFKVEWPERPVETQRNE